MDNSILDAPERRPRRSKWVNIIILIIGVLLIGGLLFRLMHWPGAGLMILLGSAALLGYVLKDLFVFGFSNWFYPVRFLIALVWVFNLFITNQLWMEWINYPVTASAAALAFVLNKYQ